MQFILYLLMMTHTYKLEGVAHPRGDAARVDVITPPAFIFIVIRLHELIIKYGEEVDNSILCLTLFVAVLVPFLYEITLFEVTQNASKLPSFQIQGFSLFPCVSYLTYGRRATLRPQYTDSHLRRAHGTVHRIPAAMRHLF